MITGLLVLAFGLAPPAYGAFNQSNAGTAAAQFLKLGADARSEGMGEAVHAESSDANSPYWNPAGLAGLRYRDATITYGSYYQGVSYDYAAYAQPVPSILGSSAREREIRTNQLGAFGISALYLNAGQIPEADNTGILTGNSYTPQDAVVMLGWGVPLTRHLDVGITGKYITERIEETATSGAFDAGARLHLLIFTLPYTLSAGIQNVGGRIRYITQQDVLPTNITVGNSLHPSKNSVISFDMVAPRDSEPYFSLGGEYRLPIDPGLSFAVRMGWQNRASTVDLNGFADFSAGGGITLSKFTVDYAWVPYGVLGETHRFTFSYRF
jgi:hypothetical protein